MSGSTAATVKVRVLHAGHGRIATGEYDYRTNRFSTYSKGDTFDLDFEVACAQEANGLLEILADSAG